VSLFSQHLSNGKSLRKNIQILKLNIKNPAFIVILVIFKGKCGKRTKKGEKTNKIENYQPDSA
jgi:hypothetical protein